MCSHKQVFFEYLPTCSMNGIPYVHKLPHTRGVTREVRGYTYAYMLCADCRGRNEFDVDVDHLRASKLSKIQNGGKQPIEQNNISQEKWLPKPKN